MYRSGSRPTGTQFTTQVISGGGAPDAIVVSDVNHDGRADIIVANPESGSVAVLLGDGQGHFQKAPRSPIPAGHLPSDIGVGDFNGDGNPDLLIVNTQTPPHCTSPRRVAVGNVFGSQLHDFAVTCTNSSTVLLFSSQRGGGLHLTSLDAPAGISSSPTGRGVLLADLLGRGRDDIILSNGSAGTITLLLSKE